MESINDFGLVNDKESLSNLKWDTLAIIDSENVPNSSNTMVDSINVMQNDFRTDADYQDTSNSALHMENSNIEATGNVEADKSAKAQERLLIHVLSVERHSKRQILIRFDANSTGSIYRSAKYRDIRRTHNELVKLADHLIITFPGYLIPAVPDANYSIPEDGYLRLQKAIQKWFDNILSKPGVASNIELRLFVESDTGYSPMIDPGNPTGGLRRKVIKAKGSPPDDTVELTLARAAVKAFYKQSDDAKKKLDRLLKARKQFAQSQVEVGMQAAQVAYTETHTFLCNAIAKYGKCYQIVGEAISQFADFEAAVLCDSLAYHSRDAFIAKEILSNRNLMHRDLITIQNQVTSKQAVLAKQKISGDYDSEVAESIMENLELLRQSGEDLKQKFEQVTNSLIIETRFWTDKVTQEIRGVLFEYAKGQIEDQRKILALYTNLRPEIRNIDNSGGLSRLGRDSNSLRKSRPDNISKIIAKDGLDSWSGTRHKIINDSSANQYRPHSRTLSELDAKKAATFLAQFY